MAGIYYTFIIVENFLIGILVVLTLIYAGSVLSVDRFRHFNNMYVLNICLAIAGSAIYFGVYFTMRYYSRENLFAPNLCTFGWYTYALASIEMQFSFITFSVHRFCAVVYHQLAVFKRKIWFATCIITQWLLQCLICLPFVFRAQPVSINFFYLSFILSQYSSVLSDQLTSHRADDI